MSSTSGPQFEENRVVRGLIHPGMLSEWFSAFWSTSWSRRRRHYDPSKLLEPFTQQHSVTTLKNWILSNTAVWTLKFCNILQDYSKQTHFANYCKLSLLYCSNSCTSLHFKTLKSHTKTLKIHPYVFRSPLKPSAGGAWPYFATLLNWNVDLHLL